VASVSGLMKNFIAIKNGKLNERPSIVVLRPINVSFKYILALEDS
jgi:hypothetical protein